MENSQALRDALNRTLGKDATLREDQAAAYSFDGYTPEAVVVPTSVQDIQTVLQYATQQNLSIVPAGAGTKLGIGNLPEKIDLILATTRLNNVIEYEPADLTVTVEAGIRLAELQKVLAAHRQYLALNPPYGGGCTIGGIVATNVSGPLRLRHGTARNQVLGLQVIRPDGTRVKSGGKVVKNVAGYDLNKLYIGAFGTLGIITEVTLKLTPVPTRQAILTADFPSIQEAADTGLHIVGSQMLPLFVNLSINPTAGDTRRLIGLVVGFGGDPETVTWELTTCQEIMEQNGAIGVTSIEGKAQQQLQETVEEFPADNRDTEKIVAKFNLKRTDIAEIAARIADTSLHRNVQMMALIGSGVLYVSIPVERDTDFQELASTLTALRQFAIARSGNLIIEAAPPQLKGYIDVWGAADDGRVGLMRQIKAKFDPNGLLNPGRFVSNI